MTHLPRSSFSSSSSSTSSDLTPSNPPNHSSRPQYAPSVPTLSTSHFNPARSPSEASLRFTHTNDTTSLHNHTLARLLLAPVLLTPAPSHYLSCFAPAANLFHSLLALLAKNPLPHSLHHILTTVSVHPHLHQLPSLTPKDAVAVDFVRAVADFPPRIPIELRNAFRNMYNPDRAHQISLLVSFAAYYSTVARLLGLTHPQHHFHDNDILALTEPSEMSAPSSTAHSRASSTKSKLPKRLSTAKNTFLGRVAHPFRLKLARHATRLQERSTWLSDIPSNRRSQDDLIRAAMGFTPEYLTAIKNNNQRAVFIYLIDELLLRDSACGISTAVKNLCCYILARSAENSVLTAHSIFLANRYGADDRQLTACTDLDFLTALHHASTARDFDSNAASSSCTSSEEDIAVEPLRPLPSRRRRRADRFRYSEFAVGVVIDESGADDDDNEGDQLACEQHTSDEYGDRIEWNDRDRPNVDSSTNRRNLSEAEKDHVHTTDTNSTCNDEHEPPCREPKNVPLQSSYVLPEDPKVPEVDGLNSMSAEDFASLQHDEYNDEGVSTMPSHRQFSRGPDEGLQSEDGEIDVKLFSPKEVSFLLLAHQVAQASRRNSKTCKKYAGATPGPLIMPDLATVIHGQFDPDSIMEMISVIGAFSFLLRWTVCCPYRPGALEAPVRRFVQTPIAHDLCVDTVGQRTNSKHSLKLRLQTGRSFRLPRHAAAYEAV